MGLSKREVDDLLEALSLTKAEELTCGDCLKLVAEFAESSLAGKSPSESLQAVKHHLDICAECREEYEALLTALKDDGQ